MRLFLRVLKWLGIGVAGLIGLVVLAYGVLVVINWSDEPPSEAYLAFEASLDEIGPLDHPDNAYVYALGLGVPEDEDPVEFGRQWVEWSQLPLKEQLETEEPSGETLFGYDRSGRDSLLSACRDFDEECAEFISSPRDTLSVVAAESQWIVTRYQQLLELPVWYEPPPDSILSIPFYNDLMYSGVIYGHRAWQIAREGAHEQALDMLDQEARFLRMVHEKAGILLTRMVVLNGLRNNLQWTNAILQMDGEGGRDVPEAWQKPISPSERSMSRAAAGELVVMDASYESRFYNIGEGTPFLTRLEWAIGALLLQNQANKNLMADIYAQTNEVVVKPYPEIMAAADSFREYKRELEDNVSLGLKNPVGVILMKYGLQNDYTLYLGVRSTDLEGARRVLILAQQLRAEGVTPEEVPARLQTADIRNPYTEEPFGWDAEAAEITFNGLAPGDRNEFSLKY